MEAIHVLVLLGHSLVRHHQRDHVRYHRRASRRRGQRNLAIMTQTAWPHRRWRASWIALEAEAMIKKGDYLVIKPEWRDAGDEAFTWVARSDEQSGRVDISAVELAHLPLWPVQTVRVDMVEHRWAAQEGHKGRAPD